MIDRPQDTSGHAKLGEGSDSVFAPSQALGPRRYAEAARRKAAAGDVEGALADWREALWLAPDDAQLRLEQGVFLIAHGRLAEAIECLQQLIRHQPEHVEAHVRLGEAWRLAADPVKAAGRWRRALELNPADPFGLAGRLAALAEDVPDALPAAFVRTLFDHYADRFDAELVETLGYRGPAVIVDALMRSGGGDDLDILDLGCGTGLAGPALRPLARRLAGIDVAPRMIERARDRQLYDRLSVGEMTEFLAAETAAWDVIAAADVLVYVGDLTSLFAAAAAALKPNGRFIATSERLDDDGFVLQDSRRFAHGEGYVRRTAQTAGLTVRLCEEVSTRHDRGRPVPGLVFVLVRAGAEC